MSGARIEQARDADILDVARRTGAQLKRIGGAEWAGPCPACGGRDRFAVNTAKQIFICRGGGAGDAIAMVQHALGVDFADALDFIVGDIVERPAAALRPAPRHDDDEHRGKIRFALALFAAARKDAAATPIKPYFDARRLEIPAGSEEWLAFHPDCVFGEGQTRPCMLTLFRDNRTDEPLGVQRSAIPIWPDAWTPGRKIERMMLGQVKGASIKVDEDARVTYGLHLGEGAESALAARQCGFTPIWAAGSKGAIASFDVLPVIQHLTVFREPDAATEVQACIDAWCAAGRGWSIVDAAGKDMNAAFFEAPP